MPVLDNHDPAYVTALVQEHGVLLVRDPDASLDDFVTLSEKIMSPMVHHATGTVERDPVSGDSRTSTVNKGADDIPLHREGSYAPGCPDLLMFYCARPAASGGATQVCDGVEILRNLPDEVRERAADLELCWRWTAPPDRWQSTLGAKTPDEARLRMAGLRRTLPGYESLEARFEGDLLHGTFRTPCVIPTRWSGQSAFCNSLLLHHFRAPNEFYERELIEVSQPDGSPVPADLLAAARETAQRLTVDVSWDTGDILIVDNSRFMHGRTAFSDTGRSILIRMGHVTGPR
jgi:alpha-ketoglutarate-dependent taurine dioxygenase